MVLGQPASATRGKQAERDHVDFSRRHQRLAVSIRVAHDISKCFASAISRHRIRRMLACCRRHYRPPSCRNTAQLRSNGCCCGGGSWAPCAVAAILQPHERSASFNFEPEAVHDGRSPVVQPVRLLVVVSGDVFWRSSAAVRNGRLSENSRTSGVVAGTCRIGTFAVAWATDARYR